MIGRRRGPQRYAELHYLAGGLPFSGLHQPWPEIYIDAPWRLEAGRRLPLFIVVRDADKYPCRVDDLELHSVDPDGVIRSEKLPGCWEFGGRIEGRTAALIDVAAPGDWDFYLEGTARSLSGKGPPPRRFRNQLARGFPEEPLRVRVADRPLPALPGLCRGDPHVHSSATLDQVEFGAPPELIKSCAEACGVHWFALTDHSYDLDDRLDDHLRNDPGLPVWHGQQSELRRINRENGPLAIPGEEVSCRGVDGDTLHLLVLDPPRFFRGRADSGESLFRGPRDHGLEELLEILSGHRALPVSAHTGEKPGRLERLVLGRRAWRLEDLDGLACHQLLSGALDGAFRRGLELWRSLLRSGRTSFALAGGDAHGDFNLSRRIRSPLLSVEHSRRNLFGRYCSAVIAPRGTLDAGGVLPNEADRNPSEQEHGDPEGATRELPGVRGKQVRGVLEELGAGRCLLGDGPLLWYADSAELISLGGCGGDLDHGSLKLRALVTRESGVIERVRLWRGGPAGEECAGEWTPAALEFEISIDPPRGAPGWLRAELRCRDGFAMTNPVFSEDWPADLLQ